MRLKGLGGRAYNTIHHAHTVTGMMISLVLFVIFYTGAYSLFRAEIYQWENPEARSGIPEQIDYERVLHTVNQSYKLDPHDPVRIIPAQSMHPEIQIYASASNPDGTHDHIHGHMDLQTYQFEEEDDDAGHQTMVSETLFRLHYLAQIPTVGLYISGFVALFFLLATVTGLLIHWRNIFQKFYAFFVGKRWKQIWTDAHTVVGIISLPFQVMYAITGALFGLSLLLLLPTVMVMFGGDQAPVLSIIRPELGLELDEEAPRTDMVSLNELKASVAGGYPDHTINQIAVSNYGHQDAVATFYIDDEMGLMGNGSLSFQMADGDLLENLSRFPYQKSYGESVYDVLVKLHFGTFGGYLLRFIYFLLALLSCFMIISGVLIWQVARDNSHYSDKQKLFHHRITKLNLSVCLSLFPAVAILFIANKMVPMDYDGRGMLVEQIFFVLWLLLAAVGWKWDQYGQMNKNYFVLGGLLSLLVPVLNGIVTGDWLWHSWGTLPAVAGIDILWLLTGCLAIWAGTKISTDQMPESEYGSGRCPAPGKKERKVIVG